MVEFKEAFVELEPDQFQEAPDWIAEDQEFKWALRDGDIKLVQPGQDTSIRPAPEHKGTLDTGAEHSGEHHLGGLHGRK
jgi:hypothetical protein